MIPEPQIDQALPITKTLKGFIVLAHSYKKRSMQMLKKLIILFALFVILAACSGGDSVKDVDDFNFLVKGISYQEITAQIGEADQNIGSGTYVYVYELSDGENVYLTFIQLDSLYSANLVDSSGNVIEILVSP